jgi:GAF domain-containing protein
MLALDLGKIENVAFKEGLCIPIVGTPEEEAMKTGRTVLLRSVDELQKFTSPWVHYAIEHGLKSEYVNPPVVHGRTLGPLGAASLRENAITTENAKLLEEISGQIAIAVPPHIEHACRRGAAAG